jgi:peptidoglycan/xylan/chitin deacetylase (PgdA/CDA1 family)
MDKFFIMSVDVDPPFSSRHACIIKNGINALFDLFNKYAIKVTFFVPATVAVKFSEVIKRIVEQGHEIGCHGFNHSLAETMLCMDEKIQLIKNATSIIESIGGVKPIGFRAPFFKIDRDFLVALKENDYVYDSSCISFPSFYFYKYERIFFLSRKPFYFSLSEKNDEYGLLEIPVSVNPILPFPLGAAWLRIFGSLWSKMGISMNFFLKVPVVVYVHPKDVVTYNPYGLPWYFYQNTDKCLRMLDEIIAYAKKSGAKILKACELAKIIEKNQRKVNTINFSL